MLSKEKESIIICIQNKQEKILEQLRHEMADENENLKQNNEVFQFRKRYSLKFLIITLL